MPAVKGHNATLGIPRSGIGVHGPVQFSETIPIFEEANQTLSGQTVDGADTPIASCTVYLMGADFQPAIAQPVVEDVKGRAMGREKLTPTYVSVTVSDGSGNFSFPNLSRNSGPYFLVAYNPAGTLVGTTLNSLVV